MGTITDTRTVVTCYTVFDKLFPTLGMLDYTDGVYRSDPEVSYEKAQENKFEYLLEQGQCTAGSRLFEIGCGNGTLLEAACKRGVLPVGITVTPAQVALCQARGLDVRLQDYKDLDDTWNQRFDTVIANGCAEHFVQPADVLRGEADDVYRGFFQTAHRLIDPDSQSRRLVTTTIHFVREPHPERVLQRPATFARGSDDYHYALLAQCFGGWYPVDGQLERCARGTFKLVDSVDGTEDYRRTSETWLRRVRERLRSALGLKVLARSVPVMLAHPSQFRTMVQCLLVAESWNWQFRGATPPTRLLRHTWEYQPR